MSRRKTVSLAEKVDRILAMSVRDEHGCLIYQGARHHGYAFTGCPIGVRRTLGRRATSVFAHSIVALHHLGPRPPCRPEVRHLCGRGALGCVTPEHLAYGSRGDNVVDTSRHGTHNKGKLTPDEVRWLRLLWRQGASPIYLGHWFGVSEFAADKVAKGRSYAWVV